MMNDFDIYDNGTPKYHNATDIYDALYLVESGEEIRILSEMFADVSWENQDYYYIDNGGKLVERWNAATDYGNKMWLMDVAVFQLEDNDANEWVYEILCNDDLAKRIGFKKLFIDTVLYGSSGLYNEATEAFTEELQELDRFDFYQNSRALMAALSAIGYCVMKNPYSELCSAIYKKLKGIRLDDEKQLIAESRALLTSYDDFMFGLKSNQFLYNRQEEMYQQRVLQLKEDYAGVVKQLLMAAQLQGVSLELPEMKYLGHSKELGKG